MTNFTFFMVGVLLISAIFSLTGCGSAPVSRYERNADYQRRITMTRYEADDLRHQQWVDCVKSRGLDSGTC